jgi:hypothetical protein
MKKKKKKKALKILVNWDVKTIIMVFRYLQNFNPVFIFIPQQVLC